MSDAPEPDAGAEEQSRPRPHIEASRRVAQIMRAAEDAASELRMEAERRADARIAEASRAAQNRVAAAEEEATELVTSAEQQATELREKAAAEAGQVREEAEREAARLLEEARQQADEVQRIAEVFAIQTRETAEQDARDHVARARQLAAEILHDGTEMSHNLQQLSTSLRKNAETLLMDVTRAHRALIARLDEAGIDDVSEIEVPPSSPRAEIDLGDIPEFIPSAPRRGR